MPDTKLITDIHADDYALTLRTSEEMLELMKEGVFDSISIVPNSECYDECMQLLIKAIPDMPHLPKISVHLNLVEGLSLAAGDGSLIKHTWKSLFLASFNPFRRKTVRNNIRKEITAQIRKADASISKCIKIASLWLMPYYQEGLRIDSHQHSHMIPVVWDALMDSLNKYPYEIEYIRNSAEPLIPFLKKPSLLMTYRPVNLVKNRLLWLLSGKVDRYNEAHGNRPMYLWGLIMSGRMDADRIEKLYPVITSFAQTKNRVLEILFHPGRMTEDESTPAIPEKSAASFYLSPDRDTEKKGAVKCRSLVTP